MGTAVSFIQNRSHFTDFPLNESKFYFTDNVILLPSEY
jgi:hypothetical protein